jgi:hypothetical protein
MADALKRISITKNVPFQERCTYYMYQKAAAVFAQETPDADDLLLAKALWAGQVKAEDMARIVVTNATVGGKVDADTTVPDSDIEYVVMTETKFHDLASAYKSAGLIGV